MMFLQFFVWGTWYATMGAYLDKIGFSGVSNGAAYSTISWGAIISPLFVGMIADRFFSAEKVMALLHIVGAGILWSLASITDPTIFFWTLLGYSLLYMPTLALSNAICFFQMTDPSKEFPFIRVLGTIGWIVAGWTIALTQIEDTNLIFKLGAISSVILGIYSLSLPKTPPKAKGKSVTISDVLGLDAMSLLKNRNFAIFAICSLLISIPLSFYYAFASPFLTDAGMEQVAGKMTFGQWSEILFLLLIPFFFKRLGVKKMLLIGMLAWMLRYLLFSWGISGDMMMMLYMGIILHGICYDFFFVTGQIYVDNAAPKEIQASAQGFITLITYGFGMLIGSLSSGYFVDMYTTSDGGRLWDVIWLIPAGMAVVAALLFFIFFKDEKAVGDDLITN